MSPVSRSEPTTTCPSRSRRASYSPGSRRSSVAPSPDHARTWSQLGDVTVNVDGREVTVNGSQIELTAKEFDLLTYFVESPGVVHSRDRLLDRVWGISYPGGTRTVDVHVGQLRRKLGRPELIRTVRGAGYKSVSP